MPAIEHSCRVDVIASAVQMARRAVRGQPAPRLLLTRVDAAIEKPVTPMKMMPAGMVGRQGQVLEVRGRAEAGRPFQASVQVDGMNRQTLTRRTQPM